MNNIDEELVLAHFIVSDDVERFRRFYTDLRGGKASDSLRTVAVQMGLFLGPCRARMHRPVVEPGSRCHPAQTNCALCAR